MYKLFFDGACEPCNPGGIATYGWFIERNRTEVKLGHGEIARGEQATNNIAEWAALVFGLSAFAGLNAQEPLSIYGDSQLVINQALGKWQVKADHLKQWHTIMHALIKSIQPPISFQWIRRDKNKKADQLSKLAYKEANMDAQYSTSDTMIGGKP